MYHQEHGITNYGEMLNALENDRDAWQTEALANLARAERAEAERDGALMRAMLANQRADSADRQVDKLEAEAAELRAQLEAMQVAARTRRA